MKAILFKENYFLALQHIYRERKVIKEFIWQKVYRKHNRQDKYRKKRFEELMKNFNDRFEECMDVDNYNAQKAIKAKVYV